METNPDKIRRENATEMNKNPEAITAHIVAAKQANIGAVETVLNLARFNGIHNPLYLEWIRAALKCKVESALIEAVVSGKTSLSKRVLYEKIALKDNVTKFFQSNDPQLKGYKTVEPAGFKNATLLLAFGVFETQYKDDAGVVVAHGTETKEVLRERAKKLMDMPHELSMRFAYIRHFC